MEERDVPEPFVGSSDQSRQVPLNILNIIQFTRQRIIHIHHNHLPIRLPLIEQSHNSKNFNLLNLTDGTNLFTNFAHVEGVVVPGCFGLGMSLVGVLPGLGESTKMTKSARFILVSPLDSEGKQRRGE